MDTELETEFQRILLDDPQKELLCQLIEAFRSVPKDRRQKFIAVKTLGTPQDWLIHPGFPSNQSVYQGDYEALEREQLVTIEVSLSDFRTRNIDITSRGFRYYKYLKGQSQDRGQNITNTMRTYLEMDPFQKRCPEAYQCWFKACLLYTSPSPRD